MNYGGWEEEEWKIVQAQRMICEKGFVLFYFGTTVHSAQEFSRKYTH